MAILFMGRIPDDLVSCGTWSHWRGSQEFLEDKSMAVAAAACQALGKLGAAPYLGAGAMVKACESPGSYPQQYGLRVQHPSKSEGLSQRRTGIRLCDS